MKKTAKLFSLPLALLIAVSAFSACGQKTDKPATDASKTESVSAGELDTSKEVELSLYVVSDRPSKQDEVDENMNKLFKEKLNATLKTNWIGWAEYANKYPLLFSSGEKFDMAYTATWLNFASLAQKGAFMNLDELWPKYAPKNFERQSDVAKQQATVAGHYYCVPTLYATYSAYGPLYRTDILKETDWDGKMENIDDYEKYLGYVKKNTQLEPIDIYQAGSEMDDLNMWQNGMYALKGSSNDFLWIDPKEADPKIFTYYEYDGTAEFLERMKRWNEAGFFTKSALSDTDSQKMKNGKAASRVHNIDSYTGAHIEHPEQEIKWANMVSDVSYMAFTQDAMVISNTAENPERALALYDLITSDEETYRTFYYGIEGVTYNIVNNEVEQLNMEDYAFSALWTARTNEFHLPSVGSPKDLKTFKDGFDSTIKEGENAQKFRSFSLDISSIETEYAACQSVHQQYWWPLELGYTDAASGLEEYKQKMEAAGIERVREVLQGQLDEYLKNTK